MWITSWDPFLHWELVSPSKFSVGEPAGQWGRSWQEEKRDWSSHCRHVAVHSSGGAHHDCLQSSWVRIRQRHLGAYHLRLQRHGNDGSCELSCFVCLVNHFSSLLLCCCCCCCYCFNLFMVVIVLLWIAQAFPWWGICDSGTERGPQLHWCARSKARGHSREENTLCQGHSAERAAASCGNQQLLWDQEGLLPGVSTSVSCSCEAVSFVSKKAFVWSDL